MNRFFSQLCAIFLLLALVNSHIVGPVLAVKLEDERNLLQVRLLPRSPSPHAAEEAQPDLLAGCPIATRNLGDLAFVSLPSLPHIPYLEEVRSEAQWSKGTQRGVWWLAVMGGGMAAATGAVVFGSDSGIAGMFEPDRPVGAPELPLSNGLIAGTTAAGVALFPNAMLSLYEVSKAGKHRFFSGHHHSYAQRTHKYSTAEIAGIVARILAIGGLTAQVFKELAEANSNNSDMPLVVQILTPIAAIPYGVWRIWEAREIVHTGWESLTIPPYYRLISPDKHTLHDRLAAGRRLIGHDPDAARALDGAYAQVDAALRAQTQALQAQIAEAADVGTRQQLEDRLHFLRRCADAAKFKLLCDAGQRAGPEFQTPNFVKAAPKSRWGAFKRFLFGGKHPWWDNATKVVGMAASSLAYVASFYSWQEVGEGTFSDWEGPSLTAAASLGAAAFGSYLVHVTSDQLRKIVRIVMGYHPIDGEAEVTEDDAHFGNGWGECLFRAGAEVVDWARRILYMLPVAIGAGEGMFEDAIPLGTQLIFLIPHFIAWGAAEDSLAQRAVTALLSKNPTRGAQHRMAHAYGEAAEHLRHSSDVEAANLRQWMDKPFAEWLPYLVAQGLGPDSSPTATPAPAPVAPHVQDTGGSAESLRRSPHSSTGSSCSHQGSPPRDELRVPLLSDAAREVTPTSSAENSPGQRRRDTFRMTATTSWPMDASGGDAAAPAPVPVVAAGSMDSVLHASAESSSGSSHEGSPPEGGREVFPMSPTTSWRGDESSGGDAAAVAARENSPRAMEWTSLLTHQDHPTEALSEEDQATVPAFGEGGAAAVAAVSSVGHVSRAQQGVASGTNPLFPGFGGAGAQPTADTVVPVGETPNQSTASFQEEQAKMLRATLPPASARKAPWWRKSVETVSAFFSRGKDDSAQTDYALAQGETKPGSHTVINVGGQGAEAGDQGGSATAETMMGEEWEEVSRHPSILSVPGDLTRRGEKKKKRRRTAQGKQGVRFSTVELYAPPTVLSDPEEEGDQGGREPTAESEIDFTGIGDDAAAGVAVETSPLLGEEDPSSVPGAVSEDDASETASQGSEGSDESGGSTSSTDSKGQKKKRKKRDAADRPLNDPRNPYSALKFE